MYSFDTNTLRRFILNHVDQLAKYPDMSSVAARMLDEVRSWDSKKWETLVNAFNLKNQLVYSDITDITKNESNRIKVLSHTLVDTYDNKIKENGSTKRALVFVPTVGRKELIRSINYFAKSALFCKSEISFHLCIIFDGRHDELASQIKKVNKNLIEGGITWSIVVFDNHVGYIHAMVRVLKEKFANKNFDYIGFLDDDAFLLQKDHYLKMLLALNDPSVEAVSGLAVDKDNRDTLHDFFNIGNSYDFLDFARKAKRELSKPHIHGGGGGCLMRAETFRECLCYADKYNVLVGPTVSAIVNSRGNKAVALQSSLVLHKTRSTFYDWLIMVKRYYNSWLQLQSFGAYDKSKYTKVYKPNLEKLMCDYDTVMLSKYQALCNFRRAFRSV